MTRRVVLQGGRTFIQDQSFGTDVSSRRRSAATEGLGLRRRAHAHGRRRQLRQHPHGPVRASRSLCPAHSLPLPEHLDISFPLSWIYLGADRGDPRLSRGPPPALSPGSWSSEADAARIVDAPLRAAEEEVDGLHCLKIRVDHWTTAKDPPRRQYLWLAPERDYHCAQEESGISSEHEEMRVVAMRELASQHLVPRRRCRSRSESRMSRASRRSQGRREPDRDDRRRGRTRPAP